MGREFANQCTMSISVVNICGLALKLTLIYIRNIDVFSFIKATLIYVDLPR